MINFLAKSLVMVHTVFSLAAMTWALWFFLQAKDYAWIEPRKEVLVYNDDGTPKTSVRHASEYDKSVVALEQAVRARNLLFTHVKPALESIEKNEPFVYENHLHYLAEMKRLRESPDKIEVKRLKDGGLFLEVPGVGRPISDDAKKIDEVSKSFRVYQGDLKKLDQELKKLEDEINVKVRETREFTKELTGTDELNKYVHPGLYQLHDREFKAQSQLKVEIDELKPYWSQSIEQARQHRIRRTDLESTLKKLKDAMPPVKK